MSHTGEQGDAALKASLPALSPWRENREPDAATIEGPPQANNSAWSSFIALATCGAGQSYWAEPINWTVGSDLQNQPNGATTRARSLMGRSW